ncbi:c-type cytochrome [Aliifodinibius sp. S!AR15-10]|uniref:c-type cytochrome n=1 Tax=Aliifodinibius sp. S!AR15-10 TaxID=2950437 RepID=UPI00285B5A6B|nr:c-type cytochrome [Aliifodinibius sp. S!AR15-10]MDR8393215.1 c-type cytochrome [Aliifodinibius sp. S!AR15-10]
MKEGPKVSESSAVVSRAKGNSGFRMFLESSKILAILIVVLFLGACRGQRFEQEPVHPNMNMDQQERFEAQEQNSFFADNRSMRQPVEGTISRGNLRQDPVFYQGINEDSSFVSEIPVEVDKAFLYRGQNGYEVYCTPCHGKVGDGQGIVMTGQYGFVPAPTFHQERLRNVENGYLYSVIANGIRNMPAYAHQIKVQDRWAIVAYIRALQRSQYVPEEDIQEYDVDLASLQSDFADQQKKEQAQQEAAAAAGGDVSAARGEELYVANGCQACHSRDGSDGIGPTHQGVMGRTEQLADGSSITVDEEYLRESIVNPSAKIVEGYDPVMAPYSYLSDSEIQSLIEYLKTLSDNQ